MTNVIEPTVLIDVMAVIDRALPTFAERELVSSDEVTDMLLDLRGLLSSNLPAIPDTALEAEPVAAAASPL